jgi:FeS assembly SUF system protein
MDPKPGRVPLEVEPAIPPAALNSALPPPSAAPEGPVDIGDLQEKIIAALRTCYDPEIPVNIYELGLVYNVDVEETGDVQLRMTLTSPACPVAGSLPPEVEAKVRAIPGVRSAKVELVWDPPWNPDRMSEAARLQLGFF